MAAFSLLEGCQNIFEKNDEIWKSYFSRWETLAGLEEELPEKTFVLEKKASKKKQRRKTLLLRNKGKLKEEVVRGKKVARKSKNNPAEEVIEQPKGPGNENLPEEIDNKQLEMRLRTIFMDILKANKNKWEVFAVLSQTFSHGDVAIKGPRSLHLSRQLTLPSNDGKQSERNLFFRKVDVFLPNSSSLDSGIPRRVEFFETRFSAAGVKNETFNCMVPQIHNTTFNKFKYCEDNRRQIFPEVTFTPPNARSTIYNFKSCPPSFPDTSRDNIKLNPLAVDFCDENSPKSWRKIKNENFCERRIAEMNISREEKRFGSLCLHKRTNDLNMENSNFITTERNSSKRKYLSENISQRKWKRPTKLFFDFWDSSDSENEELNKSSTPRIGCQARTREIGAAGEVATVGTDSDESDTIL